MVQYNFKKITVVPNGNDLIDIILSRTQRQTPSVVHKGYKFKRLRQLYMRKVKYTQTNIHEKLSTIIEEFPRLFQIHPFYGDILHVLYNKDHYKLALGQVNTARNLISKIAKDYVKLLKSGDSLNRCKCLKLAALGRMCTVLKSITPSLAYLEQIRQHMARLPSIDPNTRTEEVLLKMSTLTEEGVISVLNAACERLLDAEMKSKKINDHLNRFHVAMPKPRDNIERLPCIPQAVLDARVYSASLKKHYILYHEEWKDDIMPEILDGRNDADFVDPDISLRLEELEREEEYFILDNKVRFIRAKL